MSAVLDGQAPATAPAASPAGQPPYRPSMLDCMMMAAEGEAERIAIWQDSAVNGGRQTAWDDGMKARHKLWKDLAQLVHLVRLCEPEVKAVFRKKLGTPTKPKATGL